MSIYIIAPETLSLGAFFLNIRTRLVCRVQVRLFTNGYQIHQQSVVRGKFRVTSEQLKLISRRGTELLLNATQDQLKTFKMWS